MEKRFCFSPVIIPYLCFAQPDEKLLLKTQNQIETGRTINGVLEDTSLVSLHSLTEFRDLIKKNATAGKLFICSASKPGKPIIVKGIVSQKAGTPASNALLYAYQTDNRVWYSDTAIHVSIREGDRRHARLFGYLRTGGGWQF